MSISRSIFRELGPLFRALDDPFHFAGHSSFLPVTSALRSLNAPAFPSLDISEKKDAFIVEADVPGVQKEDLDITIGDQGRSVTIASLSSLSGEKAIQPGAEVSQPDNHQSTDQSQGQIYCIFITSETKKADIFFPQDSRFPVATRQHLTERGALFTSFSRTFWLPQPVKPTGVEAKLKDGVLTLTIPKAEDSENVKIQISD